MSRFIGSLENQLVTVRTYWGWRISARLVTVPRAVWCRAQACQGVAKHVPPAHVSEYRQVFDNKTLCEIETSRGNRFLPGDLFQYVARCSIPQQSVAEFHQSKLLPGST
jgi:hypothetical protein